MLKNYLLTAWRSVKKNKRFFALNFIGLYVSIVACTIIALIILHETSFDRSEVNEKNIYRVVLHSTNPTGKVYRAVTPYPLATALRAAMPDQLVSQIHFENADVVSTGDKKFKEHNILFADSVFPRLFPMTVKTGSIQRALAEPGFAILTEKTARRLFGNTDAVGHRIRIADLIDLQVAAVVADPPSNSHLPYGLLVSYLSMNKHLLGDIPMDQWSLTASGYTYVGLGNRNQVAQTETILKTLADNYVNKNEVGSKTAYKLQPMEDIHYNQLYAASNIAYTVDHKQLYLIGAIGLFLILAACINYTNLSTALAIKKSREVGVRKTMGATRGQLMGQFFSETFFLTGFVVIAAALSVRFLLPQVNAFLDKDLPLQWLTLKSALFLAGLWITASLFSGLYPALVLSRFNPITALKNKISAPKASAVNLRRGLVTFQFLIAQTLIICAIVVAKQMSFVQSMPLGFTKDKVLDLGLPDSNPQQQRALTDRLSALPGISSVSLSLGAPVTTNQVNTEYNLKEKYKQLQLPVKVKATDHNYLKTYGLQLIAGRWFDQADENLVVRSIPDSLRRYAIVLNEQAVHRLGFSTPQEALGRYVTFGLNDISAPVIGVTKDFNVASLHEAVAPVLMVDFPPFYYNAGIKFSGDCSASTLSAVEKVWTSVYPQQVFETNFPDEHIAQLYKDDRRAEQLFYFFTFLSITINILGLIGLLSFMIEQKTKEIGIRKILGATVGDISFILSRDFLWLIVVAFLIAAPIAGYFMHRWLQDFAYRTDLSWWVFAVAVCSILAVTGLAVAFQTIRAAVANPVKSLRTE